MAQTFTLHGIDRSLASRQNQYIWPGHVADTTVFDPREPLTNTNSRPEHPTAFVLEARATIPLVVRGSFAGFVPNTTAAYVVDISMPDGFLLRSTAFPVAADATSEPKTFTARDFSCEFPLPDSPFGVLGDATVRLRLCHPGGHADVAAVEAGSRPHLELYFFLERGTAATNASGAHMLDLIRIALPPYGAVRGRQWAGDLDTEVASQIGRKLWQLPTAHPRCRNAYDVRSDAAGASHHLMGNQFNLNSFFADSFSYCNCVDLAELLRLLFLALGRRRYGNHVINVIDARTQSMAIWGYIPEGPLFGWDVPTATGNLRRCNNPFWLNWWSPNLDAALVDPCSASRTFFRMHRYVCYETQAAPGQLTVADCCHASLGGPGGDDTILAVGVQMAQYAQHALEQVVMPSEPVSIRA